MSSDPEQFIAAPAGVQFHEVTAAGLVKVNSSGSLMDSGSMSLAPTKATFGLAAAMHGAREDVKSVVFLCNPSAVSVSQLSAHRRLLLLLLHLMQVTMCQLQQHTHTHTHV